MVAGTSDSVLPCGCTQSRETDTHGACFNADRTHRFAWWRRWANEGLLVAIMLNPSTADENVADPTITRVVNFAKDWGLGGVEVVNAFSLRSTDPEVLHVHASTGALDPFGTLRNADTDAHIAAAIERAEILMVGWGVHLMKRPMLYRVRELRTIVDDRPAHAWDVTKHGAPKHPLYVHSDAMPVRYVWPT